MGGVIEMSMAERRKLSAQLFTRALDLEQRGGVSEAKALYEQAIIVDPQNPGALVNLGTTYFHEGMVVKAKELYLRAITVDPNYALAYFNLANLLDADWKTTGEAVRCYQMAIDVNPDYADAHYNLALCLQNRGELMEAAKHWLHYLRLDQGSSWSVVAKRKLDDIVSLITIKGGRDD